MVKEAVFLFIHIVKAGETVSSIANRYGVNKERLISDNGILDTYNLAVGQALVVLIPKVTHIVEEGETLQGIAQQYGISVITLLQNNPFLIQHDNELPVGQELTISFDGNKDYTVTVNAYAYPDIDVDVLEYALPFISRLTVFGYGFTKDGELIAIDDEFLIKKAYEYGAEPIMLISSIDESGTFESEHAYYIFSNEEPQQKLIDNIIKVMQEKGYRGLDIDFEFVSPEYRDDYISFIENVTEQLNAYNFTVNADLAPKTSSDQKGLLYESHDYGAIGEIVNSVLLMTYEWGYTYEWPRYKLILVKNL